MLSTAMRGVDPSNKVPRSQEMTPQRNRPLSVVMPVHNARPFLDEAVKSILDQSFGDFEFIIFDDGSTDGSAELLKSWAGRDERIRLVVSERNLGPVGSSNRVVELARTDLVARMDADDISQPDRLKLQFELLRRRPDIGLAGTLFDVIDEKGHKVRSPSKWRLAHPAWSAPFPHGSIMFRRSVFDRIAGYREPCVYWEDHDLYWRASEVTALATVPIALYSHRHSQGSTRIVSNPERVEQAVDLVFRCMERLERGQGYEDLLAGAPGGHVDPRVFVSLGSIALWGGRRPKVLRRLLARSRLRFDLTSASVLAWATWATVHPPSLRSALRFLSGLKNALNGAEGQDAVLWRLPRPLQTISQSRPTIASAPAKR